MDLKKNVLVEYYAGVECETIVVRLSGGESKLFGSCDEFVEFLRSSPVAPASSAVISSK